MDLQDFLDPDEASVFVQYMEQTQFLEEQLRKTVRLLKLKSLSMQ